MTKTHAHDEETPKAHTKKEAEPDANVVADHVALVAAILSGHGMRDPAEVAKLACDYYCAVLDQVCEMGKKGK